MATTEEKIAIPINYYKHPLEVDADQSLSVEKKITLLLNWLDDINKREIAEGENMHATQDTRGDYIEQIETLLRKYRAK